MEVWTRYRQGMCSLPSIREDGASNNGSPENTLLSGLACRISVLLALLCFPPRQAVSFCFGGCCEAPPRLMDWSNTSLSGPSKSAHYCPNPHSPPPQAGRALPHSPGQLLVTMEHGDLNTAKAWPVPARGMLKLSCIPRAASAFEGTHTR